MRPSSGSPARRFGAVACLLVLAALASPVFASTTASSLALEHRWGFQANLGAGSIDGDLSPPLTEPQVGEFGIFQNRGDWRFGGAISFGSFKMTAPYEDELEWGYMRGSVFATRMFNLDGKLRPYLQGRVGFARLHPRSELFAMDPLPADFKVGDSPTKSSNGWSVALVPGLEYRLGRALALDLSAMWSPFGLDDYDLTPVGYPPAGSGSTFEGRLGLTWFPQGESVADTSQAPRDAWGKKPSYGWAAGEVLAINLGASYFNEYVRNANFNQISPRSWWENLHAGFHYDDNQFRTNQYIHPFNGSQYYNSGRANGLDYWSSSVAGIGGAFFWEAFGETHPMSYNDLINTGFGGIALGEVLFRMSSMVLDNRATGSGRTWREVGGFLIDPVRGFNRFLSGDGTRSHDNPVDPTDWRPHHQENWFAAGVRFIGKGESISDSLKTNAFLELYHRHGDVFENTRRGPFDFFDLDVQVIFGEKVPLAKASMRGSLWEKPLGAGDRHLLAITQHFEYLNNVSFEFGGQSFGPTLFSRYGSPGHTQFRTRADLLLTVLGAVNSDYAFLAEVEDRERFREYDYGPGVGLALNASAQFAGGARVGVDYRLQWLDVRNGSVFVSPDFDGSDADHVVQALMLRGSVPVRNGTAIGADAGVFLRNSNYSLPVVADVTQRNPQARVYLLWTPPAE
jgi:hypothetical protein